jgi:plastocyanin
MNKRTIIITVVVLILAAGVYGLAANNKDTSTNNSDSDNATSNSSTSNKSPTQASNSSTSNNSVSIENLAFSPSTITVKKGTSITWTNDDTVPHTVTENDGQKGPASGTLNQGEKYSFTYDSAGTFQYHCTFHADMKGTVVVTE